MRVTLKIETISKTAKICQTDLCNDETSLTENEKLREFLSHDMVIFAIVNLGTISYRNGSIIQNLRRI